MPKDSKLKNFQDKLDDLNLMRYFIVKDLQDIHERYKLLNGHIQQALNAAGFKSKTEYDQAEKLVKEFLDPVHKEM